MIRSKKVKNTIGKEESINNRQKQYLEEKLNDNGKSTKKVMRK